MHAIHHNLIHPRLIARHQNELALSDEQKDFIKKQIRENQSTIAYLEWDLANRVNQLETVITQHPVNENQALEKFNALLEVENSIKRLRFNSMLRINNSLSQKQLEILKSIEQ